MNAGVHAYRYIYIYLHTQVYTCIYFAHKHYINTYIRTYIHILTLEELVVDVGGGAVQSIRHDIQAKSMCVCM